MRVTLDIHLDVEGFETSEYRKAVEYAEKTNGEVFSWKNTCRSNWLERGPSRVDTGILVVVPKTLPDHVDMCDDLPEDD